MLEFIISLFQKYAYLIMFLAVFIDSLPFGGLIVPEEVVMAFGGFVAHKDSISLWLLVILATAGMFSGQVLLYKLGQKQGLRILEFMRFPKHRQAQLQKYMEKNKSTLMVLPRFSSTTRSVVGLLSGLHNYNFKTFCYVEFLTSLARSMLFILLGYAAGKSLEQIESLSTQIAGFLTISILFSIAVSLYTSRAIFLETNSTTGRKQTGL